MLTLISYIDGSPLTKEEIKKTLTLAARSNLQSRFIVIESQGKLFLYVQVDEDSSHSILAEGILDSYPEGKFVAGGYIPGNNSKKVRYDSESCRKVFGHDRPKDEYLQDAILKQIAEIVQREQ